MENPPNGTSVTQERLNKKPRLDSKSVSPEADTKILEQDSEPGLYDGDDIPESQPSYSVPPTPTYPFSTPPRAAMSPPFGGIPGLTLISGEKTEEQVKQDVARSMEFEMTSPSPVNPSSPSLKRSHPEDGAEDVRMTSPMPPSKDQMDESGDREKTPVPAKKPEETPTDSKPEGEVKKDDGAEEEFRFDSSDGSDSDDESSSDDSSDDDSDEEMTTMDPAELAKKLMEEADEDGDVNEAPPKTKNELDEPVIQIPDIDITDSTKLEELGTVTSVVGTMLLIRAKTSGEYQVLNEQSVLATAERKVFGVVNDTIGRVEEPLYTVLFNSSEQIKDFGLAPGKTVYYLPEYSTFVFTKPLIGQKGSDASNLYDEEIPEEEQEFSDDEEEAARKAEKKKAKQKNRKGGKDNNFNDNKFNYEATIPPPNYDDEPYVPLQRPAHLPNRPVQPPPRPSAAPESNRFQNNNNRDDGRRDGRGGRGGGWGGRGGWNNNQSGRDQGYNDQRRDSMGTPSNQRSPVQNRSPVTDNYQNQSYPAYGQYPQPPQQPAFTQSFHQQSMYSTGSQSQSPPVTPFSPPPLPPGAHINPAFFRQLSAPSSPAAQSFPQQFNFPPPIPQYGGNQQQSAMPQLGSNQQPPIPQYGGNQQWPVPPPPPFPPTAPGTQHASTQGAFPTPWLQNSISPPPLQQPIPVSPGIPQAAPSSSSTNATPTGSNDEAFKKIQDKLAILSQLGGI